MAKLELESTSFDSKSSVLSIVPYWKDNFLTCLIITWIWIESYITKYDILQRYDKAGFIDKLSTSSICQH